MKKNDNQELTPFVVTARVYYTTLTKKFINRKVWVKPVVGEVKASLPGTVRKLNVNEGDIVKVGAELMTFEAMKMQNKVYSPINGTVRSILVAEGDSLKKNQLMIIVE